MNSSSEPFELSSLDVETPQFLGLNLDVLVGLATFADLSEGFTIAFVEVNFAPDATIVLQALQQRPECQDIQFVVLHFPEPERRFLLDDLKQMLPTLQREPDKKLVLVLRGLEQAIGVVDTYPPLLKDLNFVRDAFPVWVPHPIIVVLPDYALTRVAQFAPDFWAWTSGVFKFRSAQQTVVTAHAQTLHHDRLFTSDTRPVKQERIDLLQRLLTEYAPSGDVSSDAATTNSQRQQCLTILQELGDAYSSLADYTRARLFYQQALELAIELEERHQQATIWLDLGRSLPWWDNAIKALDYYNQALERYRDIGARLGEANTLQAIGDVLQFLDRRDEALARYESALAFYRDIGDRLGEANTLQAIGDVQDNPEDAMGFYDVAQALYLQIGDRYSYGRLLVLSIAPTQLNLGQRDAAIASLTRAAALGAEIQVAPLQDYALERLEAIQNENA